jgi:hypothetical protein
MLLAVCLAYSLNLKAVHCSEAVENFYKSTHPREQYSPWSFFFSALTCFSNGTRNMTFWVPP